MSTKSKAKSKDLPRPPSAYSLTKYRTAPPELALCSHSDRIPGLDADTCKICQMAWPHKAVSGRVSYHGISLGDETLLGAIAPKPEIKPPVEIFPNFLNQADGYRLFNKSKQCEWQRNKISMGGKVIPVPRDEVMYGDCAFSYSYSGVKLAAKPWPEWLSELKSRIEDETAYRFAVGIGNKYTSGKDFIGWHSDDKEGIPPRSAIASLTLGSRRKFKLRHKASGKTFDYELKSGTLLIMLPGCQEEWVHSVPKTAKNVGTRINWTFRQHKEAIAP